MAIRLRYAPSPTGAQHLGGIRTALFCFLMAKSQNGSFILRIEDTDRSRYHPDALEDLYTTLSWLGISWDEGPDLGGPYGPYVQSSRIEIYHSYIQKLIQKKCAYYSEERRAGDGTTSTVVRLKMPETGSITTKDCLLGDLNFRFDAIPKDPVLIKSDGFPTYHFANVVDDHLMRITHVFRSQEWVSSLPIHWYLYELFQWKRPQFYHLPLIIGSDGKKLSKRHGSTSVLSYRDKGILPETLWNFLALLGWSYDDKKHFFTKAELLTLFSLDGINKSQAMFDAHRMDSLNAEHLKALSKEDFVAYCTDAIEKASLEQKGFQDRLAALAQPLQERCAHFADLSEHWQYIGYNVASDAGKRFSHLDPCDASCVAILDSMLNILRSIDISPDSYTKTEPVEESLHHKSEILVTQMKDAAKELDLKVKNFFMCVQESITGRKRALPVAKVIVAIGIEEALQRLEYRRKNYVF